MAHLGAGISWSTLGRSPGDRWRASSPQKGLKTHRAPQSNNRGPAKQAHAGRAVILNCLIRFLKAVTISAMTLFSKASHMGR